jgi:hypothetical protein
MTNGIMTEKIITEKIRVPHQQQIRLTIFSHHGTFKDGEIFKNTEKK